MKFNEFIEYVKSVNGVDTDGYYGKQCMDLYNFYCNNVLGLKDVGADCAKNILNNQNIIKNTKKINNTPSFVPKKGDIAVWTGGTYGHVAICLGIGDINTFRTIDQNWKLQQLSEEVHNYTYLGPIIFLRPNNQDNIQEQVEFTVRVDKAEANVRRQPNTNSELVMQPGGKDCLRKGDVFAAVGTVVGENISGNNIWYKSKKGNYVWSGGLTKI